MHSTPSSEGINARAQEPGGLPYVLVWDCIAGRVVGTATRTVWIPLRGKEAMALRRWVPSICRTQQPLAFAIDQSPHRKDWRDRAVLEATAACARQTCAWSRRKAVAPVVAARESRRPTVS